MNLGETSPMLSQTERHGGLTVLAKLVNCAFLAPNQEGYSVEFKNGSILIVIATTPKPLVLTLREDGTIVGPGPSRSTASSRADRQAARPHPDTSRVEASPRVRW